MKDENQIKTYELPQFKRESIIQKIQPTYVIDKYGSVSLIKGNLGQKINELYSTGLN